jgi:hypothetical protein
MNLWGLKTVKSISITSCVFPAVNSNSVFKMNHNFCQLLSSRHTVITITELKIKYNIWTEFFSPSYFSINSNTYYTTWINL